MPMAQNRKDDRKIAGNLHEAKIPKERLGARPALIKIGRAHV